MPDLGIERARMAGWKYLTEPFAILEPQNMSIAEFNVVQERQFADFGALKLTIPVV